MQIKEQWKASKNWKVVTGVATAATLSLGAIAVAAPGSSDVPSSINLSDRANVSEMSTPSNGDFVPFSIDASFDSVSDDSISTDSVSDDSISTDSVSDDSISTDSVSDDSISFDSVSDDSISSDSVSDDSISDDSFDSADDSD